MMLILGLWFIFLIQLVASDQTFSGVDSLLKAARRISRAEKEAQRALQAKLTEAQETFLTDFADRLTSIDQLEELHVHFTSDQARFTSIFHLLQLAPQKNFSKKIEHQLIILFGSLSEEFVDSVDLSLLQPHYLKLMTVNETVFNRVKIISRLIARPLVDVNDTYQANSFKGTMIVLLTRRFDLFRLAVRYGLDLNAPVSEATGVQMTSLMFLRRYAGEEFLNWALEHGKVHIATKTAYSVETLIRKRGIEHQEDNRN